MVAVVLAAVLVVGILYFAGVFSFSVVPRYKGMEISSVNTAADASSATAISRRYDGDYSDRNNYLNGNDPYGDGGSELEEQTASTLQVISTGDNMYYADAGDEIYITIKFYNPDQYEIVSFTLSNGTDNYYYSGMYNNYEDGSNPDQVIVKLNVGNTPGVINYTISKMKYLDDDGVNSDVYVDGDTVVSCGVRTSNMTTAAITDDSVTLTSISFNATITDRYSLISGSGGSAWAVLFDGENVLDTVDLTVGESTYVTFTNLSPDTLYQYAIVAYYDDLSGGGTELHYMVKKAVYTAAVVLFDGIEVGQESITFGYSWYSGYENTAITSLTLTGGGETRTLSASATSVTDLLSNTDYVLTAQYIGVNGETTSITLEFTTEEKATPAVAISSEVTQTSISYSLAITDTDGVGSLTSVTLYHGGDVVQTLTAAEGTFENLLSNNEYTIKALYDYDLNDGNGGKTVEAEKTVITLAKAAPSVDIEATDYTTESLTFTVDYTDTDGIGAITKIELYNGDALVKAESNLDVGEYIYTGLNSYTEYTLKVTYVYDLNDGDGEHTEVRTLSEYTAPYIAVNGVEQLNTSAIMNGTTISLEADMTNPDGVKFDSVVINGVTYSVSTASTKTALRVEIANNGQFEGGDTAFTISQVVCVIDGRYYTVDIEQDNSVVVFINGEITVEDFLVVRKNDSGEYEQTDYGFSSEQLYYQISLSNATGYEVYGVNIGGYGGTSDSVSIIQSDDYQTVYIPITSDWINSWPGDNYYTLTSFSYKNDNVDKTKNTNISVNYRRLSSDDIVEISTADQLLDVDDNLYYKLVNDIDLKGKEWGNMGNNMYGVFDGNGFTISYIRAVTSYDDTNLYLGLFAYVGGIVTNLNVSDMLYMVTLESATSNSYGIYVGGIGANVNGNAIVRGVTVDISVDITANVAVGVWVGGLFGEGTPLVAEDIKVDAVVSVTADNASDINIGGMFGRGYYGSKVNNAEVSLTAAVASAADSGAVRVGGIFGALWSENDIEVSDTTIDAEISVDVPNGIYMGGVIGVYGSEYPVYMYGVTVTAVADNNVESGSYIGGNAVGAKIYTDENCSADITHTDNTNNVVYYWVDRFKFSYSNGVYTLVGYVSSGTDVVLPDNIKGSTYVIGESVYSYTNITSVVISDGVTSVGQWAFDNCTSLTSVVIGNNVTTIAGWAFNGCRALTSVVIGENVTTIDGYAFSECTSLTTVYYCGTASEWRSISIGDSNQCLTSATIYYYSETEPASGGNYWHYVNGVATAW